MGIIKLNTIRLYAHHGCLDEEGIVGSAYEVNVEVEANLRQASHSDHLSETVDYVHIHQIVSEEMKIRSKLLEHVAQRIIDKILGQIPLADVVRVAVSKINPPIGGDVDSVTVALEQGR